MIYLDAAGLSNPVQEPYVVMAGIIVEADKQWKALSQYLSDMADEVAPPEHREGFAFHATELFSGGKIFPREKYEKEWRWRVLDELCSIPKQFDLPIVWGYIARSDVQDNELVNASISAQCIALTVATTAAEEWMKRVADPDEIAQLIIENDHQARQFMAYSHRYLSDPQLSRKLSEEFHHQKLTRIIYPAHFEEKTDSSALQVADVCAFVIKRHLMGKPEAHRFYDPLGPYLVNRFKHGKGVRTISSESSSDEQPS